MGLEMIGLDIPCFRLPNHVPGIYPKFNIMAQVRLRYGNSTERVENCSSLITFGAMARFLFEKL